MNFTSTCDQPTFADSFCIKNFTLNAIYHAKQTIFYQPRESMADHEQLAVSFADCPDNLSIGCGYELPIRTRSADGHTAFKSHGQLARREGGHCPDRFATQCDGERQFRGQRFKAGAPEGENANRKHKNHPF